MRVRRCNRVWDFHLHCAVCIDKPIVYNLLLLSFLEFWGEAGKLYGKSSEMGRAKIKDVAQGKEDWELDINDKLKEEV